MAIEVSNPYQLFTDSDGTPLEGGHIYVGEAGLDAKTNPVGVYFDEASAIPAEQPIRTLAGYASGVGGPANLFTEGDHSISVLNKNGTVVYSRLRTSAPDSTRVVVGGDYLPDLTADTMLVDNAAGTAREVKTFAQVRQKLQSIPVKDLAVVEAWNNGVPGLGNDQTTALQALVNKLPPEGGRILLLGDVVFSNLDFQGRRNILFEGAGGNGAGAAQRTVLKTNSGAIGAGVPAIKAWGTFNVSFAKMMILAQNAAFDGTLLAYNSDAPVPGDDSALMSLNDVYLQVDGAASAKGLSLYGATQGSFSRVTFAGKSKLLALQEVGGVGFCNVHVFNSCNFKPSGSNYPVTGSGEAISFIGGNAQASSGDGIGRFWNTSLNQEFRAVCIQGMGFYDTQTAGGVWCNFYRGQGLTLVHNNLGGVDPQNDNNNYGFNLGGGEGGVKGFTIESNVFRYMTAGVSFGGTQAAGTGAQKGGVRHNACFGGSNPITLLLSGIADADVEIGMNFINNGAFELGSHMNFRSVPQYADRAAAVAAGHTTGDVFVLSSLPHTVEIV